MLSVATPIASTESPHRGALGLGGFSPLVTFLEALDLTSRVTLIQRFEVGVEGLVHGGSVGSLRLTLALLSPGLRSRWHGGLTHVGGPTVKGVLAGFLAHD